MPSPSASPIGSSSSSVSSSPSSPDLGHERSQPGQATHPIQHRTGDVHEILKRYFYDLHVQKYLGQLEMARLQPPEWTQKQQQQFATLESSSSGAGGEGMGPERKRYLERQTKMLRGAYRRSKYISRQDMVWLAEECGLTSMQVGDVIINKWGRSRTSCHIGDAVEGCNGKQLLGCLVRAHVEWWGRAVMRKSEAKKIELTPALMTAPEQIGLFGWH